MSSNRCLSVIIALLGAADLLLQTAALRSFFAVFAGNELVLGIALGVWLGCAGAGSMAGRGISRPRVALGLSVLLTGLLAQPLIAALPLIRPFLALAPGETVSLGATVLSALLVLGPFCFLIGLQFPLATATFGGDAARVYRLEAFGAMSGGTLFTFLLAGKAGGPALLAAVSTLFIGIGAWLLRRPLVVALMVLPLLIPAAWERLSGAPGDGRPSAVLHRESRYGPIDVYAMRGQANVFASGRFLFAYPDQQSEELTAHLAATLHPAPRRILLMGGSPAAVRELLKYRGATVEFLENDPALLSVAVSVLAGEDRALLAGERSRTIAVDARRHLKDRQGADYDLIIMNLPEPTTASDNRFYTEEYFQEARHAIAENGVIVLFLPPSPGYMGARMQQATGAVFQALSRSFRHSAVSSGEYGLLIASNSVIETAPDRLRERFVRRRVATKSFHGGLLADAFEPLATARTRTRLDAARTVNSDERPVAYLNNLLVWADLHGSAVLLKVLDLPGALLALLASAGLASAWLARGRPAVVPVSVFLGGFASMSFSLVLLLGFQAAFGSVYEQVGLLTGAFMAGSCLGAAVPVPEGRALARLRQVECAAAALFLASLYVIRTEALFYLFSGLAGVAGGALFAAAVRRRREGGGPHDGGMLYGLDLAGGVAGALLTAILLVPLFGSARATLIAAGSKAISLTLLFTVRHEQD